MRTSLKTLAAGLLGATALVTVPAAVAAADDAPAAPTSIVEDFSYPGAAEIERTQGIKLIAGDGRILLNACDGTPGLITVESVGRTTYCFKATGATGWLSLRLDRVFLIGAGDEDVEAKVTVAGETETVSVSEGDIEPVGTDDAGNYGVLLELRTAA